MERKSPSATRKGYSRCLSLKKQKGYMHYDLHYKIGLTLGLGRASDPMSVRRNWLEFHDLILRGFTPTMLRSIKRRLKLNDAELAAAAHVHVQTIRRKLKTGSRLSSGKSDNLFRMVKTFSLASIVLGDEQAQEWMRTPHPSLGGDTPLNYTQTDPGACDVRQLLEGPAYCAKKKLPPLSPVAKARGKRAVADLLVEDRR
ncbi:MAG: antitoxin Xre/MbcA/ParS toxin-binding domain-containing protein [Nitrospirota bacterium]